MTEHYTPTTEGVRARYAFARGREVPREDYDAEFDRWLARVRAETWDEVADYLPLIVQRLTKPIEPVLDIPI